MHRSRAFHRGEGERFRHEDEVAGPAAGKESASLERETAGRFVEVKGDKRVFAAVRDDDLLKVGRQADCGGKISVRPASRVARRQGGQRVEKMEARFSVPPQRRDEIAQFRDEKREVSVWMEEEMAWSCTGRRHLEYAWRGESF